LATKIKTEVNDIEFFPGSFIEITSSLYDQAADLMEGDIILEIYDQDNLLIYESTNSLTTSLSTEATPGTWIVKSKFEELTSENKFIIKRVREIEAYIEDGILYIKNIGNVDYIDATEVVIGDETFKRDLNLEPNEITEINLGSKVEDDGNYNVSLITEEGQEDLGLVNIKENSNLISGLAIFDNGSIKESSPYVLAILVVIIGLFLYFRFGNKTSSSIREQEVKEGRRKLKELKKTVPFNQKGISSLFAGSRKLEKEEVEDFKESILKRVKEEPKKEADEDEGYKIITPSEEPVKKEEKETKSKGGLFDMFN